MDERIEQTLETRELRIKLNNKSSKSDDPIFEGSRRAAEEVRDLQCVYVLVRVLRLFRREVPKMVHVVLGVIAVVVAAAAILFLLGVL